MLIFKQSFSLKSLFIVLFFLRGVCFINAQSSESEVPILVSANNSMYQSIVYNLQLGLNSKSEIIYLTEFEEKQLQEYFSKLSKKEPKLVITLGNYATLKAKENLLNVPIVYSMVNAPKLQGLGIGTNTCGVHTDVPISEIFRVLKEFRPNMKRVRGYTSGKISEYILKEGEYVAPQFEMIMEIVSIKPNQKVNEDVLNLNGSYDAIYIVPDPIYTLENLQLISNFVMRQNKILATQIPFVVNLGTTFSITPFFSRVGVQLAELSNMVLKSPNSCKDGFSIALKEFHFQINKEYTESSNVYIPFYLEQRMKDSSLILEGIQYFEMGNYELSQLIMEKILKSDQSNPTAIFYKKEINKLLHGTQLQSYWAIVEEAKERENFVLVIEYLSKILKLEPTNEKALELFEQALELESELELKQAERLERNEPFLAIQHYTKAIQIYSKNQKAKQKLSSLRAKVSLSIPNLFTKAKLLYEQRNYEDSISILQKILLVEPNHKSSLEYLRLAQDKKLAVDRIKDCMKNKNPKCYLLWKHK